MSGGFILGPGGLVRAINDAREWLRGEIGADPLQIIRDVVRQADEAEKERRRAAVRKLRENAADKLESFGWALVRYAQHVQKAARSGDPKDDRRAVRSAAVARARLLGFAAARDEMRAAR